VNIKKNLIVTIKNPVVVVAVIGSDDYSYPCHSNNLSDDNRY